MDSTKTKYYKIEEYEYNGDSINVSRIKWVENIEDATVFTTNEDGNIEYAVDSVLIAGKVYKVTSFEGLKDGTYYLLETKAPDGFNKLTDMVKVVLKGNKDTNNKPIPSVEHVVVENNSGNKLPSTGGMGTKLFIVIGSLLASLSASLLVVNKRMSKEEL